MSKKRKRGGCEVTNGRHLHVGFLYFETRSYIVLLNNTLQAADLGRLKRVRKSHAEPETDIHIFSKAAGYRIHSVESES